MNRILLITLISALLCGCTKFIVGTPEILFVNENVLMPEISFQTGDSLTVYIEYWKHDGGKKKKSKLSTGKEHTIILLNLTQETRYDFQIRSEDKSYESEVLRFITGKVPREVLTINKEIIDSTAFNGYILVRRFFKSGADVILNNQGDIVWYHLYDTVIRRPNYWTKQNSILSIYDTAQIVETDLIGNRLLDLDLFKLGNPTFVHHEILFDKDGNIVTLTADSVQVDARPYGGKSGDYVFGDGVIRLSREGKTLWKWSLLDNVKLSGILDGMKNFRETIGHANSIAIANDGNYLVSFRDFDQVWKIDSETGFVLWKLGRGGDFKMDTLNYFMGQHSIHLNEKGNLVIFDNGKARVRPNSRVLSLKIDEEKKETEAEFLVTLPRTLSSYRMCSAYEIDVDKLLICTSRQYLFVSVINKSGDILWKVKGDNSSYRAYYIEDPFALF